MTHFYYMPGKKLLVADDSLTIQKVIRLALINEGYEIQAVSEGTDAIQQISLFQPDIVLIDVSLPGKSAFEVKREINQHDDLSEIRFVLMSSAFEQVDEIQAEEVVFHSRLIKPFDPAHLRQVLSETLAQVSEKRMEETTLLQRPSADLPPPSPGSDTISIFPPLSAIANSSENIPPPPPLGTPQEETQTLWDAGDDPTDPNLLITPPPPEPFSGQEPPHHHDDIKHLTESTIRISGLDDYEWSVNEPTAKPHPNMLDTGGATFQLGQAEANPSSTREVEEPLPPPPYAYEDSTLTGLPQTPLNAAEGATSPLPDVPSVENPLLSSLSTEQIESLVQSQVRSTLEKMAAKMLPEIAEKLIKQEIHKMLSEPS